MRTAQLGLHLCRILLTTTLALSLGCSSKHGLVDNPADVPSCGADELACSGSCVRASSDPLHCGQCGNACAAGSLCCSGACVSTASCSFAVTRAVPASGWLNGGGYVKLEGAGFVRGITVSIAGAATPARVINANSIQDPPTA